jgi:hypothetical protein
VDPRTFDGMIRRLSGSLSRRSLVGGSIGASLLGVLGLGDEEGLARSKRVRAEACIPTGKKCPSVKPRGKKKKQLGCNKCCQHHVDTSGPKNKCACTPDFFACTQSAHCCSGGCTDGVCAKRAVECAEIGASCAANAECCSQLCNLGAAGDVANECVTCLTFGATCDPSIAENLCCDGLTCDEGDSACVEIP